MAYKSKTRPEWQLAKYGMYLHCDYNEDFISDMKAEVPDEEREWRSDVGAWWISDAYIDEVDDLVFRHFEVDAIR